MKRSNRQLLLTLPIMLAATLGATTATAQSRTATGPPGTAEITIGGRFIEASRFHRQRFTVDGPFERKRGLSWSTTLAVAERLALHLGSGWAEFFAAAGGSPRGTGDTHDGRGDTSLGLTWRLMENAPADGTTAAIRIAGLIPGPYDAGYTNSLGDGAVEVQGSLIVESFARRIGWTSEVGYRNRTHAMVNPAGIGKPTRRHDKVDVPNELFAAGGAYARIHDRIRIGIEYSMVNAYRGLDIELDGWRADRWPALHEDVHTLGATLHVKTPRAGTFALGAGKVVSGRNTPAYNIYTMSWTQGFRTR